jgi:hypothetical protein
MINDTKKQQKHSPMPAATLTTHSVSEHGFDMPISAPNPARWLSSPSCQA